MWHMTTLHLDDWLEYVGLLAAVSGLLLALTGYLAAAFRRLVRRPAAHRPTDASWPEAELLFWRAVRQQGTLHLAIGGAVLTLAKMIDVWMYSGGLL